MRPSEHGVTLALTSSCAGTIEGQGPAVQLTTISAAPMSDFEHSQEAFSMAGAGSSAEKRAWRQAATGSQHG